MLVVSNFWSFANDLYTEEQGKRLFAMIGVGASIGAIIGAFVPHMLHAVLGMHGLMLVAAGGLGALDRAVPDRRSPRARDASSGRRATTARPARRASRQDKKGGFALVIKDRYLRLLAVMLLVATIINTTGEYVIGKMATDRSEAYAAEKVAPRRRRAAPDGTRCDADAKANDARQGAAQDEYLSNVLLRLLHAREPDRRRCSRPGRRAAAHHARHAARAVRHAADRARRLARAVPVRRT